MSAQLARSQTITILVLSCAALLFAMIWLYDEVFELRTLGFNLEPLVVAVASAVPIAALWWPFYPKYRSKRLKGTITVDGSLGNVAEMGSGEHQFIVKMTRSSDKNVHLYFDDPTIAGAFVTNASRFTDVKNAGSYPLTKTSQQPDRGSVILLKNRFGTFCLMTFEKIEATGYANGTMDNWTIRYEINPTGGVNFS